MYSKVTSDKCNQIFISYSHKDREWLERLQTMLNPLERGEVLSVWDDTKIKAGYKWREEINKALVNSRVAVLLVSPNFLASDFIYNHELAPLLNAAKQEGLKIIWVFLSYCLYEETEIADYQAAHDISQPLISLKKGEQDRVLVEICKQIKEAVNSAKKNILLNSTVLPLPPKNHKNIIGRKEILSELKQKLFIEDKSQALYALNGLPGVGKTAIAIELVNECEVLEHFQDGVIWVGLGKKATVLSLLGILCKALNIPQNNIEKLISIRERAEVLRFAIGTRRILFVIDDVWELEAALTFKFIGANCAYLITTRLPEIALDFTEAQERITTVQELSELNGIELFINFLPEILKNEKDKVRELVQAVGGLPLALILMGNYLRKEALSGQSQRLDEAIAKLHRAEERLRLQQAQEPLQPHPSFQSRSYLSLKAVIDISYKSLGKKDRYCLQGLSIFPSKPNTFSVEAALAVTNSSNKELYRLFDKGLLESRPPNRYTLHQTIADYAIEKLTDISVYERMINFFISYIEECRNDYDKLDLETRNIFTALQVAFEKNKQKELLQGINTIYNFLESRGLYEQAENYLNKARQAAQILPDTNGEAIILCNLGKTVGKYGKLEQSEAYFQEGLALARQCCNHEVILSQLLGLGWAKGMRGDLTSAKVHFQEGLAIARQINNPTFISDSLQGLGCMEGNLGNFEQAKLHLQEGLNLAREVGREDRITDLLQIIGWRAAMSGDFDQAEIYFQECIELADKIKHKEFIVDARHGLGWVKAKLGNFEIGESYLQDALIRARETNNQEQISLLATLGWVARERGNLDQAEEYFNQGLTLARQADRNTKVSLLLINLGDIKCKRGNFEQGEEFLQEGLDLARKNGQTLQVIDALRDKSWALRERKNFEQAEAYLQEGLTLARKVKNRWYISNLLNEWGELQLKQQKLESASDYFHQSLKIAQEIGSQDLVATALYGIALVKAKQGNIDEALEKGLESLVAFENMGHARVAQVRQWLVTIRENKEKELIDKN